MLLLCFTYKCLKNIQPVTHENSIWYMWARERSPDRVCPTEINLDRNRSSVEIRIRHYSLRLVTAVFKVNKCFSLFRTCT